MLDRTRRGTPALLGGLFATVLFACVGDHEVPGPSDDPSPLPPQTGSSSSGSTSSGVTTASSGGGTGGAGGGATSAGGGGGAPPFTPQCACLRTRAEDTPGCTDCCSSCLQTAETGACQSQADACSADQECFVAIELAKSCPADANFESCVALSFDFASDVSKALAAALLDCTCNACEPSCGVGDTCP